MWARTAAVLLAVAASAAATLVTSGSALAHEDHGARATGEGRAVAFDFKFDVSREQNGDVNGYFQARAVAAGGLIAPDGPPTCVAVRGNKVGFLYRLQDKSQPSVLNGTFILITAQDNGPGHQDALGFTGPLPEAAFLNSCEPRLAPLPVTGGDIRIR